METVDTLDQQLDRQREGAAMRIFRLIDFLQVLVLILVLVFSCNRWTSSLIASRRVLEGGFGGFGEFVDPF